MYMNDGNGIYERFNIQRPADFTGHSLSVSDVVVLNDGSTVKAYYVDSIGFAELPEFFKERNMDLQKENLLNEELQEIEIFDKPGLFSNGRLRDEEVPEGLYRYDLRGSDYDPGQPITVEKTVVVNHAASVLMAEELGPWRRRAAGTWRGWAELHRRGVDRARVHGGTAAEKKWSDPRRFRPHRSRGASRYMVCR